MATTRFLWTNESTIELQAKSSVHPIHSEVHEVSGEVTGEVENGQIALTGRESGYVEVPVEALKSGNKLEDFEMRRRIEAKKYPTMRYELKEASGGPEQFKIRGALTFHGVTRELLEEITARLEGGALKVEGQHTFNIEDFGVKAPKILNLQVYPDVTIVARLVARPS